MTQHSPQLKKAHSFTDYLYWNILLAVPVITAVVAIHRYSIPWMVSFLLLALAATALILRFYCVHCPHYTREGRTLNCMFFRALPKVFSPRPGPPGRIDMAVSVIATAALILFPIYWLIREPGLLTVYLLSLAGFFATIRRNECGRCIYFECPANRVADGMKAE
jgi:hypothetical protein